jgi:N6-adenosine-specific RNA methylase IME4
MTPLPNKRYSIILADPPWRFETRSDKGRGRCPDGMGHYPVMSLDWIKALPVADLAQRDCALFLWTTAPFMEASIDVLREWDFMFKTVAFTWAKTNKVADSAFMGGGYTTRGNAEFCLLATRGAGLKRVSASVRSLVVEPPDAGRQYIDEWPWQTHDQFESELTITRVARHSAKPLRIKDDIVTLYGDQSRVELFARERTDGWDGWGRDYPA